MTLYRWATDREEEAEDYPYPDNWSAVHDNYGELEGHLVEVEPVEMYVECPGRVNGHIVTDCDRCGGEGFIIARVVVVEDTE